MVKNPCHFKVKLLKSIYRCMKINYEFVQLLHPLNDTIMSFYISLESLCDSIIGLNKSIQSVAVINNRGRVMEKISRPNFTRQFPDYLNELFCMSCVLQISIGKDFDKNYGPISYHISERSNLTMITFPINENIIIITIDKNISPITLSRKISRIIHDQIKLPA
jgi:hypothetical protein